ncbi:uncharacterized protein C8A04DRAFT_41000 [Dichotomopilus funicola]|uniref:Uncharacterized protein n=1 Tax=Dichotomopilus funicola TaxID=1934379 RepID=A0AAN6UUZ0_9PEZI|nr:hypothetical protein C8A04DRAFT_41000 [Dichotomopilus funicola]
MQFTLLALLGLASLATATAPLQPWQVSRLGTFSPSGRPNSTTTSVLNTTISDPNDAVVPAAICVATFEAFEPYPYGDVVYKCSEVPGQLWSLRILEANNGNPSSPTTNFRLEFTQNKGAEGGVFVGTESFHVGDNMSGVCGGSGVCSWGLKAERVPVLVKQELVTMGV